jgi:hypothetical protein
LVNVLPNGLKSVSGIFERPSGEIAIFVGDHLYMMEFLIPGYQFSGPFTKLDERLAHGDQGINPLDAGRK